MINYTLGTGAAKYIGGGNSIGASSIGAALTFIWRGIVYTVLKVLRGVKITVFVGALSSSSYY